jgi:uncharacterized phiE125 gp8 family phage protein
MIYSIATAPTTEPVSLTDAKMHIRAITGDTTEDAAIITPLIAAAREYCENITGKALAVQTIESYPERFTRIITLPRPPVTSVTSIKYTDDDGNETTMDAGDYLVDTICGRVAIKTIPHFTPALLNPIKITYSAGTASIPKTIRQAMLLLIGHWYDNKEAVIVGAVTSVELQLAVKTLLNQHKVWWF